MSQDGDAVGSWPHKMDIARGETCRVEGGRKLLKSDGLVQDMDDLDGT